MSEYYDKKNFSGGQKPPQKKDKEINWVPVIILFAVGLWPIALFVLGWQWLQNSGSETPEEKLRRAQKKFDDAIDSALRGVSGAEETGRKAAQDVKTAFGEAARDVKSAVDEAARSVSAGKGTAKPKTTRKRSSKKEKILKKIASLGNVGIFWQIVGGIFLLAAVTCLGVAVDDLIWMHTLKYSIENLVVGSNCLALGGVTLGYGIHLTRFSKRAKKYIAAVGGADSMDIDLIARRVGCGYKRTVKDLEKMIDKGYFGDDAYLDLDLGYFLRFGSAVEQQGMQEETAAPEPSVPKETEEGYSKILRDIRRVNDRIADAELSAKIDRLEQITGQILLAVEKKPEKRAKMHTFFDYYLPTTQKLLNAYADFEETGVEGANLGEAKERIELAMDSIVAGFAHQLDELYKADAMDVASDIKVMETMLQRDTGGAARDFGFPGTQPPQQAAQQNQHAGQQGQQQQ